MRTLPIGFLLIAGIVYMSMDRGSFTLYANTHAFTIVVGGTLAVLVMSTPWSVLRNMLSVIADLFRAQQRVDDFRDTFRQLSARRPLAAPTPNALINYAAELWSQGVDPELFIVLLSQRREELDRAHTEVEHSLRNLAKYPPALGMTGTVMGLVALFSVLGINDKAQLGPALALAMTATFYGLILANCVVTPLADHLSVRHIQKERLNTAIYQILILINRDEAPTLVEDEVKGRAAA